MKFRQILTLSLTVLLMTVLLTVPAFATTESSTAGFLDISSDSDSYEAVTYLADRGITAGTGNQCFSPDSLITVRQWAVLLCRAYGQEDALADTSEPFGTACVLRCYGEGWLTDSAVEDSSSNMCRSALLQSAFHAAGIPVYDYTLYPNGEELSPYDNILRVGRELGLCAQDSATLELMTRGEAAQILYQLLTCEYEIEEPPMVSAVFLYNQEGVDLNPYLVELDRVPEPILQAFERYEWKYVIDFAYLREFSKQRGMTCIGAASYSTKEIYVSDYTATVHEFGHFLDQVLHFPAKHEALFRAEAQSSLTVLRDYATTNSREYFAEYFAYWIDNRENVDKMARLEAATPETYAYFSLLEANGWTAGKAAA